MQDHAPTHAAASTMEEISQRFNQPIFWPPIPPNLNPIEAFWNRMKSHIRRHYPKLGNGRQRTQDSFRSIVKE
ncbi:hypothetical protein EPUL_006486, partial [Erysiphe pulchra]